jgi:hypothetical protein
MAPHAKQAKGTRALQARHRAPPLVTSLPQLEQCTARLSYTTGALITDGAAPEHSHDAEAGPIRRRFRAQTSEPPSGAPRAADESVAGPGVPILGGAAARARERTRATDAGLEAAVVEFEIKIDNPEAVEHAGTGNDPNDALEPVVEVRFRPFATMPASDGGILADAGAPSRTDAAR